MGHLFVVPDLEEISFESRSKYREQMKELLEAHLEFRTDIVIKTILEETIKVAEDMLEDRR